MKGKLIVLFSFISILLIGFIGWGFSSNTFNNVYAKHMINKNYIDINDISFSEYNEDGFVNDYVIDNFAVLSFDIEVDLEDIYLNYGSSFIYNDSLSFEVILSYQTVNFNYFDIISNSNVEVISNYKISNNEFNNKKVKSFILINDSNIREVDKLNINMSYIFDVNEYIKDSSFKENVYDLMVNKGIPFNIKVLLK